MKFRHLYLTTSVFIIICYPFMGNAGFQKGPYLQGVTPNSIILMWQTEEIEDGIVEYWMLETEVYQIVSSGTDYLHEVEIDGLIPQTTYSYRVSIGDDSKESSFTTFPEEADSFNFVVLGDTRTNHDLHQEVLEIVSDYSPFFYLNVGDLVEDGDVEDQWQTFFDIEADLMIDRVLFAVIGNHDTGDYNLFDYYFSPQSDSDSDRYYSFRFGNTYFLCLSTEEDIKPGSEQYEWLVNELESIANNDDLVFKFAFFHRPPYSSGWHCGDDGVEVSKYWVPLFEEYDFDVVFSGHDHNYERSYKDGVYYIVSGGGGAPGLFIEGTEDFIPSPDCNPYRQVYKNYLHAVNVSISGLSATFEAKNIDFEVFDTFTIDKGGDESEGETDNGENEESEDGGINCNCDIRGGNISNTEMLFFSILLFSPILFILRRGSDLLP